jgi:hypothetical protein
MRADQSAGLLSSQVAGHLGANGALEPANRLTGQRTKDAVRVPFVVAQAEQHLLDPHPIRSGHSGLVWHSRRFGG